MRYSTALAFWGLAASSTCLAVESAPHLLLAKLASLAGSNSRDCGSVALHGDAVGAMKCAKDATAAVTPYVVSFQLESADSIIWQGAAQDAHGKVWMLFYDSGSTTSGESASPTFSVLPCKAMRFVAKGGEFLDCEPVSGEH